MSGSRKEIVVVGPNPALQKTLVFDALRLDAVNRAVSCREYTGGKGTNFSRASRCFHYDPCSCETTLYTFVGGRTGERVLELYRDEGIAVSPIAVSADTRTCTTCLDRAAGTMTELIEPSHAVTADAAAAMDAAVRDHLSRAAGLAIMGSLPDGTDPDLYTRWTRIAAEAKRPVLIDAVKGIEPSLRVPGSAAVLKVNMEELLRLTGMQTAAEAFDYAMREWTVRVVAVTDGPGVAHMQVRDAGPRREFHIAAVSGVVNPLGAGDTTDAVFFAQYLHGKDPFEAFRFALAAASANCLQEDSGVFTRDDLERIAGKITVKEAH